jgi:hypothetical protein
VWGWRGDILKTQLPPAVWSGSWPGVPAAGKSDCACRRGVVRHVTTRRCHPGGPPTSMQAPAAHATLLTACTRGTGHGTCRPRWGATPVEKRGTRHLGRLTMRNGSRHGAAHRCESANACIYNICHTAPAYERPPGAETVCGKVYRATRWLKGGEHLRASRKAKRLVTLSLCRCKSCPPDAGVKASPPAQRLVLNGLKRGETAVSGSLIPETRLAGVDG